MSDLDEIYSAEWVAHDFTPELAAEFDIVAKAIVRQFGIVRSVDFGCGPGFLMHSMQKLECEAWGIEGSSWCIASAHKDVKDRIANLDIRTSDCKTAIPMGTHLIICTEVAEHIEPEHAPHLVELLCSAMCPIVFTAAPPGQDGHHHVNCQPKGYWLDLFQKHGVVEDLQATFDLKRRWSGLVRLAHMERNLMVLK